MTSKLLTNSYPFTFGSSTVSLASSTTAIIPSGKKNVASVKLVLIKTCPTSSHQSLVHHTAPSAVLVPLHQDCHLTHTTQQLFASVICRLCHQYVCHIMTWRFPRLCDQKKMSPNEHRRRVKSKHLFSKTSNGTTEEKSQGSSKEELKTLCLCLSFIL